LRIAVWGSSTTGSNGCAIVRAGAAAPKYVACWGIGESADLTVDREVRFDGSAIDVVMGESHACALVEAAGRTSVWCWGGNAYGQLGQGTSAGSSSNLQPITAPQRVTALDDAGIKALARGMESTFALAATGGAFAWGFNGDGGKATGRIGMVTLPAVILTVCQ
jgi:alpha-tubulin suppressor-like RCC1 family protein